MYASHRNVRHSKAQVKAIALKHSAQMGILMALSGAAFILFCFTKI